MGLKTPSFTLKESLVILDEALRLIRTPERWTTGKWKCPVYERDPKHPGDYLRDPETGSFKQKRDKDGRLMFAYCIEGAVNQAVINKFGPIRAEQVGALRPGSCPINEAELDFGNEALDAYRSLPGGGGISATGLISVDDIVIELYAKEYGFMKGEHRRAMTLNDSTFFGRGTAYERVMRALKTRRDRIAEALAQKAGISA